MPKIKQDFPIESIVSLNDYEKYYDKKVNSAFYREFGRGTTFRADSMKYAWNYLLNMFGILQVSADKILYTWQYYIDTIEIITFVVAILCSIPLFKGLLDIKNKIGRAFINLWLLVLFFLSTVSIAASTYNPFIYFRF